MKKAIAVMLILILPAFILAQKGDAADYKKLKDEIEQKIFGSNDPLFEDNSVPAQYSNESVIILAQKRYLETDSKRKLTMVDNQIGRGTKYSFIETFREKVLLNDQSVLKEYSEFSYKKLQQKSKLFKARRKSYSFMNIRIIKPGGIIQKINFDESVVTVSEQNDVKDTKIAIPGLNKGDIVEYYITAYSEKDGFLGAEADYFIYTLTGEYPILNYELNLQFDKRLGVEYQSLNGAPEITVASAEDDGSILSLKMKNLPKTKEFFWTSIARQTPIIRIRYWLNTDKKTQVFRADNKKATKQDEFVNNIFNNYGLIMSSVYYGEASYDFFKRKTKPFRQMTDEQLFNSCKWVKVLCEFTLKTDFSQCIPDRINLLTTSNRLSLLSGFILKYRDIKPTLLIATGKADVTYEHALSPADFSIVLNSGGNKSSYFSYDNFFYLMNQIPPELEGQKAKLYYPNRHGVYASEGKESSKNEEQAQPAFTTLPISSFADNSKAEDISIVTGLSDQPFLTITRKCSTMGHVRSDKQAALMIYEDLAMPIARSLGEEGDNLIALNNSRPKSVRLPEAELAALLKRARDGQREKFEKELTDTYDDKPKELKNYKITNPGILLEKPAFEFEEEFIMDEWIKKAGNNFIVDAGRIIGSQLELKPEQRERDLDIYMPFARSFSYTINLTIPDGYSAEGLDRFNKSVENECGGFKSSAKLEGNKVYMTVIKFYKNAFEPAANWSKLTAIFDEANQFTKEKILIKKK